LIIDSTDYSKFEIQISNFEFWDQLEIYFAAGRKKFKKAKYISYFYHLFILMPKNIIIISFINLVFYKKDSSEQKPASQEKNPKGEVRRIAF
jgi:hypothetical protein